MEGCEGGGDLKKAESFAGARSGGLSPLGQGERVYAMYNEKGSRKGINLYF